MPPAMVGIPTPASRDSLSNPRKGQIPSLDKTQNPSVLMDQSNIGNNFFSSSSFPLIFSTGKQSLSKPRTTKARKSFSYKPRPPSSSPNPSPSPSPRPFRSDKIDERLSGWNPFVPEPGARVSAASTNSDGGVFVFGSGGLSRNSTQNSNASSDSGVFVFGNGGGGGRMGCDLKRTSSVVSEEGRRLKEEMERLNIGKGRNFGEGKREGVSVLGSSVEESSERSNIKENEGVHVFGSDIPETLEKMENFNIKENFVFGSSTNESLEKMEKLNIKVKGTRSGNSEASVFGSIMKESEAKMEKMNIRETSTSMKECEDKMKKINIRETSASTKECEENMEKLNIRKTSTRSGKSKEGIKEGDKSKEGVDVDNSFVFGGTAVSALDHDLEKLKIGRESKKFVGAMPSKFTLQSGRWDSSSSMGSIPPSEAKKTGWQEQVDVGCGFVYRARENITGSFGGSAVNTVHDDMRRSKIESKVESFVGDIPSNFSFWGGEQNQSSSMGSVPPFQAAAPPLFHPPPPRPTFQPFGSQFTFGSQTGGSEAPPMELKTPTQDASWLTKENLFSGPYQKFTFSGKGGEVRGTKSKKKKGKSRQPATYHQSLDKQFVHVEGGFHENAETEPNDGYSPMDCSPYPEETVADQYSREASVVSDDSSRFISRCALSDTQRSISVDEREEVLVSAAEHLDISDGNNLNRGLDDNGPKDRVPGCPSATSSFGYGQTFGYGKETDMPKYENMGFDCDPTTASMEPETCSLGSNFERESSVGETGFIFSSSIKECSQSKFTFTSSPFAQGNPPQKRNYRRRSRSKSGEDFSTTNAKVTFSSPSPNIFPPISTSQTLDSAQEQKGFSFVSKSEDGSKAAKGKEPVACEEPKTITASSVALQEACDKWRQRGNQAYTNGYLSKAEDYYTRGINSVSLKKTTSSCVRPLTLCYSNRAATRMSLKRMREALCDCKMALNIDPNFLRAQVRAANCYLSLGDIGEALNAFNKCLQKADISSNQKIVTEASDGLHKAQEVADLTGQFAKLLLKRTSNDSSKALQMISDALLISPLSENLLEMKSEALIMMRNYEEVIQLCDDTLDFAERNCIATEADSQLKDVISSELLKCSPARLWRWRLISKSYFHLGKLEDALELIQKHYKVKPSVDRLNNRSSESSTSLSVTIHELLRLKAAGNEAFQAARHSEAVECYTAALLCNAESRPFAAVCFCNRAAAYQALGQITDAIADCSLAISLDAGYQKAISRRATLHEMIRDYGQAANDLQRLISLLEKQLKGKYNQGGTSGRSIGNDRDLKRARMRLTTVEEEARKGRSLDMYMILGVEPSSSAADVKKAYRKAALRHHPDKAGQFLVRNETVDDGLWRELADEVHNDADRLFKMIGESYTILSDPTKRLQYDAEEDTRTSLKKGYNGSSTTSKNSADGYSSPHERNTSRRWRARGNSFYR